MIGVCVVSVYVVCVNLWFVYIVRTCGMFELKIKSKRTKNGIQI